MPDTDFAPEIQRAQWEPRTVDAARDAISDTRGRISATLDAIEARIEDTKAEIRRRADVLRPVRERIVADPWRALAIGAGAGLVLGLITGGGDEEPRRRRRQRARYRARPADTRQQGRGRHQGDEWQGADMRHGRDHGGWRKEPREVRDRERKTPVKVSAGAQAVRDYAEERLARSRHRASGGERFVDHLVRALVGAVTDGLSQRLRRAATD